MKILEKHNFQNLKHIPYLDNPEQIPDIVVYPEIFTKETCEYSIKLLNSLSFNNSERMFTDIPKLDIPGNFLAKPFPAHIELLKVDIEKITGYSFNSCLIQKVEYKNVLDNFLYHRNSMIPILCFGDEHNVEFKSQNSTSINIKSGTLLIIRENVLDMWLLSLNNDKDKNYYNLIFNKIYSTEKLSIPSTKNNEKIMLPYNLDVIYTKSKYRKALTKLINRRLSINHVDEKQYVFNGVDELKLHITLGKLLGTGDWGNVYIGWLTTDKNKKRKFAVKMSRITKDDLIEPYTDTSSSWYEIWMLKNICKLIIESNICPNLPLLIDTFLCNSYNFKFRKDSQIHPATITLVELANGDLKDYFKYYNPSDDELYSCLFQIMAGLHAIQMTGQILNNDIKAKNILFYNVEPGGYWRYKIKKPNYGKMFILNDFGVSTLYNPTFQLFPNKERKVFNMGSRYAININGKFSPINSKINYDRNGITKKKAQIQWVNKNEETIEYSDGVTFKLDRQTGQVLPSHTRLTESQKSFLFKNGVTTNSRTWDFFENPFYVPPFEFYNDVQDCLRIFVGGKRATQRGNHPGYTNISNNFKNSICSYMGKGENSCNTTFLTESYQVLAGEFILEFFTKTYNYQKKFKGNRLGYYNMNQCLQSKKF